MEESIVEFVKAGFKRLPRLHEENIKNSIVLEVLKKLGYDPFDFDYEHPIYHNAGRVDIAIEINKREYLYVEIKKGDHELTIDDKVQIAKYMVLKGNIEWGLLTNGKKYILINSDIKSNIVDDLALLDKEVLEIDILSNVKTQFIGLLSKESIFETRVANYFRDIAQFKAFKYPKNCSSWNVYKGTLYNFFEFYYKKQGKYRPLSDIRVDEFIEFLEHEKNNKRLKSKETLNNMYSHIRSMLSELKIRGKIKDHNFVEERDKLISNLEYDERQKDDTILTNRNVEEALIFLSSTINKARNTLMFLLSIYLGLDRSTIRDLNWNMIDFKKKKLFIDNRKIDIPDKIINLLEEIKKENKKNGIKGNYVFYAYYEKSYNPITDAAINAIYDSLQKTDKSNNMWKSFSPQSIRNILVKNLFQKGISIEEIAYYMGIDLNNISNLISYDEICSIVESRKTKFIEKHPFRKILND